MAFDTLADKLSSHDARPREILFCGNLDERCHFLRRKSYVDLRRLIIASIHNLGFVENARKTQEKSESF